ncbi:hypothetical protein BDZ91DRAFT_796167 [Kalaharituber pfeilii]|nr:hypothetical protein BDZ91DRAFT_796167 [Kalaharituber pfeilii]
MVHPMFETAVCSGLLAAIAVMRAARRSSFDTDNNETPASGSKSTSSGTGARNDMSKKLPTLSLKPGQNQRPIKQITWKFSKETNPKG